MKTYRISKPILQKDLSGKIIREWPSRAEAGRNGFNIGNIGRSIKTGTRHKNCKWEFK